MYPGAPEPLKTFCKEEGVLMQRKRGFAVVVVKRLRDVLDERDDELDIT